MIGAVIFLVIGIIVLGYGFHLKSKTKKTKNWVTTNGKILDIKLTRVLLDESQDFNCEIKYSFFAKNNKIEGNRILPFIGISSNEENIKIYEKLKNAENVEVHYNPKNLKESCLVKESNYLNTGIIILGLTALLFGSLMFTLSVFDQQEKNRNDIEFIE
ncbi:DUF3592 domain-containing protein [Tenacibaculum crassostreae]|uniref:DUF3592 domain-containing protein n=1 Tax=Tenacibaculum crassostreae TaxID=502683 RepID=UPI0038931F97